MKEICDRKNCTGCGACRAKCPTEAITMTEGILGALYPFINQDKCIDCGLCLRTCPEICPVRVSVPEISYASYAVSEGQRKTSASGGVAAVLAGAVIASGGVVYGCMQEKGVKIYHGRAETDESAYLLKGSKYVNSSMEGVYASVRKDIEAGREVLFVGTPCQTAGVRNFLGKDYAGLYLVDLCCHGTPPYRLLTDHLEYLGCDCEDAVVFFREKHPDGIRYVFGISSPEGVLKHDGCRDFYMTGFLKGLFLRENCFSCRYARKERCSDLTLADHWGMGTSSDPEMVISKGLSTVLVNSDKGRMLLDRVTGMVMLEERPLDEALRNGQFIRPFARPEDYGRFAEAYSTLGYAEACRRFIPRLQRQMRFEKLKSMYYRWPLRQYIRKKLKGLQ